MIDSTASRTLDAVQACEIVPFTALWPGLERLVGTVDAELWSMDENLVTGEMVKKTEIGRGKRVVIVVLAVVVVVALLGTVVSGFRGRHIVLNSNAITAPVTAPAKTAWRPWWLQ